MKKFDESQFKVRVNNALERVRTILDNTRNPQYPSDVAHEYEDKYFLAQALTNNTVTTLLALLEPLGVTDKHLAQLRDWVKTRSVTLRFKAEEKCKFLQKVVREVESDTKSVRIPKSFSLI